MQHIILRKMVPDFTKGTNQEVFVCASGGKVNELLAKEEYWMLFLTNDSVGYSSEGEAWQALADFKNQKKKIDLRKAKRTAALN
jgi:hypothetical protein